TVTGTSGPDNISVTPTGLTTATIVPAGMNLTINKNNGFAGQLAVDGIGGSGTLTGNGTTNGGTIIVGGNTVTVAGVKQVLFGNTENLVVNGQAGSDTFNVTPLATTSISIDGGDPIGVLPGDVLNVAAGVNPVATFAGPSSDEGGIVVTGSQPVSYTH